MIYNSFGENFYVKGQDIVATTAFIIATNDWFMPLLFAVAGVSSAYALQKRKSAEYIKERVYKLLIPFISGLLIIIPTQTYYAERFHNNYSGGYFYQYILFFTKETDLSGYTGGFTPGHLWFILYLFLISLLALPLMSLYKNSKRKLFSEKVSLLTLPLFFLFPLIMSPVLDIGGKSFGEFFAWFMLGYLLLANDIVVEKLNKNCLGLLAVSIILISIFVSLWLLWTHDIFRLPDIVYDIYKRFYAWILILTVIGLGSRYFNIRNKVTGYLAASSFPVYLFHQTVLIAVGFYVLSFADNIPVQMILIILITLILTYAVYEICRRIPGVRFLFGIKK